MSLDTQLPPTGPPPDQPPEPTGTHRPRSYWVWRTIGGIGKAMIAAGLILLLFVAYQLWGTGLHTDRAQDRLRGELAERQAQLDDPASDAGPSGDEPPATTLPEGAAPGDTVPPENTDQGEFVEVAPDVQPPVDLNQPMGEITIPEIGMGTKVYLEGVDLSYLRNGPGHFPTTRRPGQAGNAAIAGHRTTYGAPFHRLNEIEVGDEITVTDVEGRTFTYAVVPAGEATADMPIDLTPEDAAKSYFVVGPKDTFILDQYGDNRLTLMACHPKYSARQRIVVVAELQGPPAPTPDEIVVPEGAAGDTTELLGNESGALLPAVLWGLAAALVALGFWLLGRKWRRWPAYLLGAPVFLVVLFLCFEHVERLLPAAY